MPATLRDLVAMPDLGLVVHSGTDALDRAVGWVRVSELEDPTPFLEGPGILTTPPRTPGTDVTGAAPTGPRRSELPVQEMEQL